MVHLTPATHGKTLPRMPAPRPGQCARHSRHTSTRVRIIITRVRVCSARAHRPRGQQPAQRRGIACGWEPTPGAGARGGMQGCQTAWRPHSGPQAAPGGVASAYSVILTPVLPLSALWFRAIHTHQVKIYQTSYGRLYVSAHINSCLCTSRPVASRARCQSSRQQTAIVRVQASTTPLTLHAPWSECRNDST